MKRFVSLFVACLLALSLAACGANPAPTVPDDSSADMPKELTLDTLRVEFVIGERDTDALMALQKELPPLLIDALAQWGCTVGKISVTFGASADATVQALQSSSVDVAFLPSETAVLSETRLQLAALENAPVSAAEYFSDLTFSALSDVEADSPIYENAVVVSADAPDALCDAFAAALVMLCADADGNAVMQHYGSASYLISGDFAALLATLIDGLALSPQE